MVEAPLSVSDVARQLRVAPPRISELFYRRELRDDMAPIVGGRRLIDPQLIPVIAMLLRRKGVPVREVSGDRKDRGVVRQG